MSSITPDAASFRVFLVDDNEDMRNLLEQLLLGCGYAVRSAATKRAALHEFPVFRGEVLLSDLGLPDGDGWELLRDLRQAGSSPYAIAMSGFGTLADVAASREAGFRHHLVKPIELDQLERLLEEAHQEIRGPH